ncbi:MAG: hypothetical protein LBN95_08430 [Prevotellaceae bacterium]|jgi:hypothetical protein|nr:hypothetical protein [Prevotellaceae bacterium]
MKKLIFITVIILFIVSCGNKITCEQFPQEFIEKWIPYEKNQKVVFVTDPNVSDGILDTMNFVVTEAYFWESYNYKVSSDMDCEGYCEPIYVRMIDTTKNIVLEYHIQVINNFTCFDITINDANFDSQIAGTPQHFNWYMNAISFGRNSDTGFYTLDVLEYKGIHYFEEKVSEGHYISWFLISDQKPQIKYLTAKQKGCL